MNSEKTTQQKQARLTSMLREALVLMGDDFALLEARNNILLAIDRVNKVTSKRLNRISQSEKFAEEAKKNHEKWWNTIKENTLKLSKQGLDELKDVNGLDGSEKVS